MSEMGLPLWWLMWSSGLHTLMHAEDVEVHGSLKRTCGRKTGRRAYKLVKYPSQALTANTWENGDSRVDYVSQWALEGFLILESARLAAFQNYRNHLSKSMFHIGDPVMTSGGHLPSLGTEAVLRLGVASSPFLPLSAGYRKRKNLETMVLPIFFQSSVLL